MNHEQLVQRLIDQDILALASTMVADLSPCAELLPNTMDNLMDCLCKDDWASPVREEITHSSYVVDLVTVADELLQTELTTHSGAVVDYDNASDYKLRDIDTGPLLQLIEEQDYWQAAGEILNVDPEQIEALEFWLVSSYLGDLIEEAGGLIARDVLGFTIWGRTESGQSLTMDSTLSRCADIIERRLSE